MRIVIIGAGSRSFGAVSIRDLLLSEVLSRRDDIELVLMDISSEPLAVMEGYAKWLKEKLGRAIRIISTTDLDESLRGADYVICAIEVKRWHYWVQDFHVPRLYGSNQPFGENGGIGGIFHALRNIPPMVHIARRMEILCPDCLLLNFTNPEHKLCEAVSRLTSIKSIGLCHGVFGGLEQLSWLLDVPQSDLDAQACGINHFTFFQVIRDKRTGEDLYPKLREVERLGNWHTQWHRIGMGRILFRRFGLWPSPSSNHYGEYIRWSEEFVPCELQYFYDPADGHPWETGELPAFIYEMTGKENESPWEKESDKPCSLEEEKLEKSYELTAPIIESISCGESRYLEAVNVVNRGLIPNLPDDLVVEVPADADISGVNPRQMSAMPEAIAAFIR